jgi:hypothetical protein
MFVPHRKHVYGPLLPVTGITLLFYIGRSYLTGNTCARPRTARGIALHLVLKVDLRNHLAVCIPQVIAEFLLETSIVGWGEQSPARTAAGVQPPPPTKN